MAGVSFGARSGLRCGLLSLAAIAAALTINSDDADARRHHYVHVHYAGHIRHHRHVASEDYSPPYSSIVVDGNSGSVLQASNPDAPRHPASLTKVMTLYLLFERLDAGKIKLDSQFQVSQHASDQDPTKLELKPGQTISVEDAIKGIVTKSANDAAVVVAENLGGSEEAFARQMTQTAHALGMSHTTYVNASGLPDDDQITTARDQALLGRAIQERFPRYYKYFSTETFVFHGSAMRNHNHLLGSVQGVDGIKTGFTRASGFNLLTSVHRDGRYIVAVVMGGPSAADRDDRMRDLIGEHLKEASLHRTAPMIAEAAVPHEEQPPASQPPVAAKPAPTPPVAAAKPSVVVAAATAAPHADPATATVDAHASDPIKPLLVKTITYRTAPVETASLTPMPALVAVAAAAPQQPVLQPRPAGPPAQAADQPRLPDITSAPGVPAKAAVVAPPAPSRPDVVAAIPATSAPDVAPPAPAPQPPVTMVVPPPAAAAAPTAAPAAASAPAGSAAEQAPAVTPVETEASGTGFAYAEPDRTEPAIASVPPARPHGGWLIQIGAFDDEDQAKQHLTAAQSKVSAALKAADPFTERIQKGDKALYRARFAGFDRATAEAACKQLKRSDFDCMALKD